MNALIVGAAGFVGNYLLQHLKETYHWHLSATKLPHENILFDDADIYNMNILDAHQVADVLTAVKPDYIFYLAAQSSVALSWKNPELTIDINVKGCITLFDQLRALSMNPRILVIGSGEEYGHIAPEMVPVNENTVLHPGNIYAATKACQNMLGSIYAKAYNMNIIMVRAFNHIGPGQAPLFVVSDFCRQVAMIEKGQAKPVIYVGNLSAKRDFTDVRDVVRAYGLLIQTGLAGETYNIGSGCALKIDDILQHILSLSTVDITVTVDAAKLRPVDVPIIEADISKLQNCIHWQPEYSLDTTLKETLDYWRNTL